MSRIVAFVIGVYSGLVVDQNFQVPRVPMPLVVIEKAKSLWDSVKPDDKGKK